MCIHVNNYKYVYIYMCVFGCILYGVEEWFTPRCVPPSIPHMSSHVHQLYG